MCHELGSVFKNKIPKKSMSIFHKTSGKGYNICKKFQIGSVILMAQMTNQRKTELIDYFHLAWTKNPQFLKSFLKMEALFSKTAPKIVFWRPSLDTKIPKKVLLLVKNSRKGRYRDHKVAHPRAKIL